MGGIVPQPPIKKKIKISKNNKPILYGNLHSLTNVKGHKVFTHYLLSLTNK